MVMVTAVPYEDYAFDGWYIDIFDVLAILNHVFGKQSLG
jgi:hypothetical protein